MHEQRLYWYRSAWKPGTIMHPLWWQKLDMESWASIYGQDALVTRNLDALIIKKRYFPVRSFPVSLDTMQTQLLSCAPKLTTLLVALGLMLLGCPEYLSLKNYREALSEYLSEQQLQQLLALWTDYYRDDVDIMPENIIQASQITAAQCLEHFWHNDPVWQTFVLTVPPIQKAKTHTLDARAWLFRLERFL